MVKVNTNRGEAPSYVEYEVKDASPALARDLRQQLSGCHWSYQQEILEILEWVCSSDRQFERARRRALDLINAQERAMKVIVNRALMGEAGGAAQAR